MNVQVLLLVVEWVLMIYRYEVRRAVLAYPILIMAEARRWRVLV